MADFFATLTERKSELVAALFQHLTLSFFALLIACLLAIPLGIYCSRHRKVAEIFLQIASILQTIPSLALLGILLPLVGIGTPPALIALVLYGIFPIFQNTYTGLTNIDASLKEAANAFGMNMWQRLTKVELPLALPTILSGVRTSLVLIIGTATLAALIGAGGLGTFILLGIDRNNASLTLIGALFAALLAVLMSGLLKVLEKSRPKTALIVLSALFVGIGGFSFYQSTATTTQTITIAGKLGSEPDILIQMYKALIQQASPETQVVLKPNFGKTSFLYNAVKHDQIDIYPEFTGTVLTSLVPTTGDLPQTPAATYEAAKAALEKQDDLTLLPPMSYENTYALAVTTEFAAENNLEKISDLQNIAANMVAGFTLEFADREDGYKGLQKDYQLTFEKVQNMEPSLRYEALKNGEVQVIDAYSTDSQIKAYNLKVLTDDLQFFPSYRGAPLMKVAFKEKHPAIVAALNQLAGKITEEEMVQMNYAVQVEQQDAKTVAENFLREKGLLEVTP